MALYKLQLKLFQIKKILESIAISFLFFSAADSLILRDLQVNCILMQNS